MLLGGSWRVLQKKLLAISTQEEAVRQLTSPSCFGWSTKEGALRQYEYLRSWVNLLELCLTSMSQKGRSTVSKLGA
eukprot:442096-Pelagomonas_calceolata.AAC.1